jgi:Fe-S cluster assembly iron-binding protein IscA
MSHEGNDQLIEQLKEELGDDRIRLRIKVWTNAKGEKQYECSVELVDQLGNSDEAVTRVMEISDLLVETLSLKYAGGY